MPPQSLFIISNPLSVVVKKKVSVRWWEHVTTSLAYESRANIQGNMTDGCYSLSQNEWHFLFLINNKKCHSLRDGGRIIYKLRKNERNTEINNFSGILTTDLRISCLPASKQLLNCIINPALWNTNLTKGKRGIQLQRQLQNRQKLLICWLCTKQCTTQTGG